MKLPNGNRAVVEMPKLTEYCLSRNNPRGRHKARLFRTRLDTTASNAELLRNALLEAAREGEALPTKADQYGQRFRVSFEMVGPSGRVQVVSGWAVRAGDDFPRLTTCYIPRVSRRAREQLGADGGGPSTGRTSGS